MKNIKRFMCLAYMEENSPQITQLIFGLTRCENGCQCAAETKPTLSKSNR